MRENFVEQTLTREVKKRGGLAPKFVSPGMDGMPDRIVLMPKGKMAFVELKAPGKKPRALQTARHRMLKQLGYEVFILDDPKKAGEIVDAIQAL